MDYWLKQTKAQPLFPDMEWSRPENRAHAGKLAIIGGNSYGFSAVGEAYRVANKSGIGTARVLLPDSIQKIVGPVLPEGEFAPSNPSGSFSQKALIEFLEIAAWADGVMLAGDLGRNSETAIVLEKFAAKYSGCLVVTKDAVDYFTTNPQAICQRPVTTLVLSMAQLQKLGTGLKSPVAFTFSMDLLRLVEALRQLTSNNPVEIVVKHLDNILVAVSGQVSSTKLEEDLPVWRVEYAAQCAVWRLQNPSKPFEALTTAVIS